MLIASCWPRSYATENDPIVAEQMNNLPKVVGLIAIARWDATDLAQAKVALSNIPNWLL